MAEHSNHPWGVPEDAPPPQARTTWGSGDPDAPPAARAGSGVSPTPPAATAPDADVDQTKAWIPAPGEDFDLAGFQAGLSPDAEAPTSQGTHPGHDQGPAHRAAGDDADATAQETAVPDIADLFNDDADLPVPAAPADQDPAGAADPEAAQAAAPACEVADLPDLFNEDYVPTSSNVPATVETRAPAPVPEQQAAPMAAWHAARAQAASETAAQAPTVDTSQEWEADRTLQNRYASAERLAGVVDQILALAQSGSPKVQGVINGFVLTRDAELDARQRASYEEVMVPVMAERHVTVDNPADFPIALDLAYDELIGVGPLGPLWRNDAVTEILVSGPDSVVCERDGALVRTPVKFRNLEHLRKTARDLAARVDDRTVSRTNPLVTAQLPGARVQFALAPVAPVSGVSITIRKFRPLFGLEDLLERDALTDEMAAFLSDAVAARATILVSGGTGSGKTTMINALSAFIPDSERVITIEDALELSLTNTHVESLLTKELASGDDRILIGQDELLRATLRMRPDRIIVGEIRDGSGCATMLQAANTGHDGTMTTVHANNPDRALRRLSQLLRTTSDNMGDDLAAEEVRMAFDLIVQVVRVRGRRFVSAISLVNKDAAGTVPLFTGSYAVGDPAPQFQRVGGLGSDTEMAQRFLDAGLDPDQWK